jgi:hypothetical protein
MISLTIGLLIIGFLIWYTDRDLREVKAKEWNRHNFDDCYNSEKDPIIQGIKRSDELLNLKSNIRILRIWKKNGGFSLKAYNKFKNNTNPTFNELKSIEPKEIIAYLFSYRKIVTEQNKKPKPKWIQQ